MICLNVFKLKVHNMSDRVKPPPELYSYQFPPQPGQCTLNVQFAALSSSCASFPKAVVGPGPWLSACALSCRFAVVKGGGLAGEVPQSG